MAQIDHISQDINQSNSSCQDANLIVEEIHLTSTMLRHGAERLSAIMGDDSINKKKLKARQFEILDSFRHSWLERNRPGGLVVSVRSLTGQSSPLDMPTWESMLNFYSSSTT